MVPLRIATYVGALLTTVLLTFVGIGAVIGWILSGTVPGWTSLTLLVVMISSVQLLVLGLIGEYIGRIYIQSKNRPLFVISHLHRRGRLPHNAADGGERSSRKSRSRPCWPNRDRECAALPTTRPRDEGHPEHPALYQAYQNAGLLWRTDEGYRGLPALRLGMRMIDIGCGPGYILRHLPSGIDYIGFDIDRGLYRAMPGGRSGISALSLSLFRCGRRNRFCQCEHGHDEWRAASYRRRGTERNPHLCPQRPEDDCGVLLTLDGCYRQGQRASQNGCWTTIAANSSATATATIVR